MTLAKDRSKKVYVLDEMHTFLDMCKGDIKIKNNIETTENYTYSHFKYYET